MAKYSVNISEIKVVKENCMLETQSLGSCIGVVLYDPKTKVSGLAHVMLPESKDSSVGTKPGKYCDTAIAEMLKQMIALGADRKTIVSKIVGGACMFYGSSISDFMNIGSRNVQFAKKILNELKIPIMSEDTGGNHGRTIEFDTQTGRITIKSAMHPLKEI